VICPQASATVAEVRLSIPHSRIHERRFVPAPMTELARDPRHPELRSTMRELMAHVEGQKARKVDFTPRVPGQL
jgi:7,8-dihydro-6-hydroxymethylpterin-pyrophosphokinase